MVEIDVKRYFRQMTQAHWNDWMAGRLSVSGMVANYRSLISLLGYGPRILAGIEGQDGRSVLRMIEAERLDLRIGDRDAAQRKIDRELAEVRRLLA